MCNMHIVDPKVMDVLAIYHIFIYVKYHVVDKKKFDLVLGHS